MGNQQSNDTMGNQQSNDNTCGMSTQNFNIAVKHLEENNIQNAPQFLETLGSVVKHIDPDGELTVAIVKDFIKSDATFRTIPCEDGVWIINFEGYWLSTTGHVLSAIFHKTRKHRAIVQAGKCFSGAKWVDTPWVEPGEWAIASWGRKGFHYNRAMYQVEHNCDEVDTLPSINGMKGKKREFVRHPIHKGYVCIRSIVNGHHFNDYYDL